MTRVRIRLVHRWWRYGWPLFGAALGVWNIALGACTFAGRPSSVPWPISGAVGVVLLASSAADFSRRRRRMSEGGL